MSLQYDEHRQYLADAPRLRAFRRAIEATVRPGDVVVDLGAGTGILGFLAARAGASRVYAIEQGGIIEVARQIAAANGLADRVTFLHEAVSRVTLPELADVVLGDQIGRLGFEAGLMDVTVDAARRFLRPGGRVIPQRAATLVAPIEAPECTAWVDFWRTRPEGFDISAAHEGAASTGYPAHLQSRQLLAPAQRLVEFHPEAPEPTYAGAASYVVARDGVLSGLGGWFEADLAPGVTMTNTPGAPDGIARRQAFLPLAAPVAVGAGDHVEVAWRVRPRETILVWEVRVTRGAIVLAHERRSTWRGMLVPREALAFTDPGFRPVLSPWAAARATVLHLCDGVRTLAEVERETAARHADLFVDPASAAVFVAEVVTRYGQHDPD